jgi:hypothetical protein
MQLVLVRQIALRPPGNGAVARPEARVIRARRSDGSFG